MLKESYQVIARKYRPQTFAELVGQGHVVRTLQNALGKGKVGHAFIFSGGRGVGKTTTARLLAKAVNCQNGPAPEPCNQCTSCREISQGHSLDVIEIDGASNRGIDEIRQLRENVKFAPSSSRCKVYIIDEVHMLTDHAFNALLKTLEEPPEHVKFIMATTAPDKVPLTIQSRCQRYDFRMLSHEEILTHLRKLAETEKLTLGETALGSVARAAEGSLRDAQVLLEQVIAFTGDEPGDEAVAEVLHLVSGEVLDRFVRGIVERDAADLIRILDELASRGHDMKRFLRELTEWLRGMLLASIAPELAELVHLGAREKKLLAQRAQGISRGRLQALVQTAIAAERELKASTTPRYVMELVALRMAQTADFDTIEKLVARLDALGGEMVPAAPPSPGPRRKERVAGPDNGTAAGTPPPAAPAGAEEDLEEEPGEASGEEPGEEPREADQATVLELTPDEAGMQAEGEWEQFLGKLGERKMALESFLKHGSLLGRQGNTVVVGFKPKNSFFMEWAQEKSHQAILNEVAADVWGEPCRVRLELMEKGPDADKAQTGRRPTDLMRKKQREALGQPLVQEILDTFGGEVIDVRVIEGIRDEGGDPG